MISFNCPHCQAKLTTELEIERMKSNCAVCQAELTLFDVMAIGSSAGKTAPPESETAPQAIPLQMLYSMRASLALLHNEVKALTNVVNDIRAASAAAPSRSWEANALTNVVNVIRGALAMIGGNIDIRMRDTLLAVTTPGLIGRDPGVVLKTEHPVAAESVDHLHPRGTSQDNTRWPRFVGACERHFQRPLTALDLGCSGGGLVLDFLLRGHRAVGLEGSDYSRRACRAEWRIIPANLFTCDISWPFELRDRERETPLQCDVVTAWEVLEHIGKERLPTLVDNIRRHLKEDGIFVGSVATYQDTVGGIDYHATVENRDWWMRLFKDGGLVPVEEPIFDPHDYVRGVGHSDFDAYYSGTPVMAGAAKRDGFHVVLRRG